MEKLIYFYDENLIFSECKILETEELPENATLKAPRTEVGYEPYTYDPAADDWKGVSEEEYLKAHPEPEPEAPEPSEVDKAIAKLTLNQATQKVAQDKFNANVLLQIAKIGGNK
ncbi:hypothetical protein [Companilactobacillus sp. DQM5]|uniref:hypothetical protein n=1 Tax=Companilactobacillus sp. DQM5 TaxID=3463359 RepID=UPI00405806DB